MSTDDLLAFLRDSPTPFHAVTEAKARLKGFRELSMKDSWSSLEPGGYVVDMGESSLVAFVLPERSKNARRATSKFRLVGAHTDSPNLRLKPNAEYTKEGYTQLGVEVYGGALLNSWLDRDLAIAGRVLVRGSGGAPPASRLVKLERTHVRVPQLAIHLDRDVSEKGLLLNRQEHLAPVFGLANAFETPKKLVTKKATAAAKGGPRQIDLAVARALGIREADIVSMDLMLYDTQAPALGGANDEFIFSARLDNLAMCHAALEALLACASKSGSKAPSKQVATVPCIALFDHEEVGSLSATGAESAFLPRVLERIALALGLAKDEEHRMLADSHCLSADMAHAVHPNYSERHEPRHKPVLNGGPVIKVNAQQRYATNASTSALVQEICKDEKIPFQWYAHRTDLPCGSTIGPIASALLGMPTVDVGNPMLSMHSIRELSGSKDPARMTALMRRFLAGS